MHFLESADDDFDKEVSFKNLISNFIIPFDIKNDIVYCQKSFRIYLKVHQIVITHYGERIPTLPKVKKLMYDLEREIYQINAEQKYLIIRLRRGLEEFYYNLLIQYDIKIDRDYGTQYINQMFTTSIENLINDLTLLPIKVKKRRSLEQWLIKFGIDIHINEKQSLHTPSTSPSLLLKNLQILPPSLPTTGLKNSPEMQQIMERIEPRKSRKQQQLITKTEPTNETDDLIKLSYNNIPENLILKQVSLLKPKSERSICNDDIDNDRHDNIKTELSSSNESNLIIDEDEIDKEKNKIEPIIQAKETTTIEKPKVSMSINTGRMNLLQALNKAKCQNQQIMSAAITAPTPATTSINPKSKLFKFKKMPLIRTDSLKSSQQEQQYQQNSKPSTSKMKNNKINYNNNSVQQQQQRQRSTSSDDSSGDCIKIYPNLKTELPEPTEYNQEMFLRLFGLNTIAHSIYLQQRRSKRRRRNVQSNERKDFHYGNLEISSEQMAANKEKKKKIFLVSPTANRNIKRKQIDKNYKSKGRLSSSPEDKILCNQCSKNGDYGLSRCETCRGYFHAKCHQGAFARKPLHVREKICPTCYKAQKSRSTSTDEQSRNSNNTSPNGQISLLKELHGKLTTARSRKNSLIKESETFKTKMNELFTIVDTMKKDDSENNNENNINKKIELNAIGTDQLKCQEILIDELKCNEMIINDDDDGGDNDNDDDNKRIKNVTISEEQNKFDEIMMLIHDNNSNIRKITTSDDEQNDNNLYEIYDSDISNQEYDNDIIMIIPQSAGDDDGDESIYEIQENSNDNDSGTDIEMIEE